MHFLPYSMANDEDAIIIINCGGKFFLLLFNQLFTIKHRAFGLFRKAFFGVKPSTHW